MPYEIRFAGELMTIRFIGAVTAHDLRTLLGEIEAIEAAHPLAPHRISDLSECDTADLSFPLMEELAARRRATVLRNSVKSAIIAPSPVQFGYSRMFQSLNDNPRIVLEVFRERPAAESWLGNGHGPVGA